MSQEQRLRALLDAEPGNPAFADLAAILIAEERLSDAILVCLRGLSRNPELHRGRLLLAHAYFRSGFVPFAAREVEILCQRMPGNEALMELYARLTPNVGASVHRDHEASDDETEEVADVEFDVDLLDQIDQKRK